MMRLLIYVQQLRGIGHLCRMSHIITQLQSQKKSKIKITVVTGGLIYDKDLPKNVDCVRLPTIYAKDNQGKYIHFFFSQEMSC